MTTGRIANPVSARRADLPGFTLVEVLIGVLVLALGLLGIGAVIPVVVREQRIAQDATVGRQVGEDVRTWLLRHPDFAPDSVMPTALASEGGRVAWDTWITDVDWSTDTSTTSGEYLWEPWRGAENTANTDGDFLFTDPNDNNYTFALPLTERLWPSKSAQVVRQLATGADPYRPQFVWDVIGRRVEYGDQFARQQTTPLSSPFYGKPDVIQVAIFVRRVDLSIRVPRRAGVTLFDTLKGLTTSAALTAANESRFPVAWNPTTKTVMLNAGPGTVPVGAEYAQPQVLNIEPSDDLRERDRLAIENATGANAALFRLASQPGQKLVDNLGNVYTVKGYDAEAGEAPPVDEIIITPKVPSWVPPAVSGQPNALRQIVFTPQIPVSVNIVTITRPVVSAP